MSKGFSILEFMIAISLGALIIATVGSVYLSNKSTYRVQEGLARLQENARYALYFLNYDLRMVGFQGCANESVTLMTNLVKTPSRVLTYTNPLLGFDGLPSSFSPALPANLLGKVVAGSDVVELRMASKTDVQLSDDMNLASNPVPVYSRLGIQAGEAVMLSNCSVGDIFIAGGDTNSTTITHTTTNNISSSLSTAYIAGAQLMRYAYYAYYIKNTGRTNSDNQPIYALVRQDVNGIETEIVDGLEGMRISYGLDTNNDNTADTYKNATTLTAQNTWNNVITIKLDLLFATTENVNSKPQPYNFNGTTYTPSDRKLRREWQTFITIRNRGVPS